jgi:hypothetical protein
MSRLMKSFLITLLISVFGITILWKYFEPLKIIFVVMAVFRSMWTVVYEVLYGYDL